MMSIGIGSFRYTCEPGKEAAHESQSISEQRPLRMCGHHAHNLLVLRSPRFSFTLGPRSSCGHKSVLAICVQAKGQQHHLSQNIGPVIGGSVRPALPALSERNECIKEIVPLKLFKVQSSIFKAYGKRRGSIGCPRRPASNGLEVLKPPHSLN